MCALNLKSSYWKVDHTDNGNYIHSIPTNTSMSMDGNTIAVSSNYITEGLKVYELSGNSLIHLASITLPDIHTLKFLRPIKNAPKEFKYLLSGHSNGIVHLSAIPLVENTVFENAEIIKRFNHKKHLDQSFQFGRTNPILNNGKVSTTISTIELTNSAWTSAPLNSMVTAYDYNLFYWDTARSRAPLSIVHKNGLSNVSINKCVDSLSAVVGSFGLSLFDFRADDRSGFSDIYVSKSSMQKSDGVLDGFTNAIWCDSNPNYIATNHELDNTVYIWDIRKHQPVSKLTGFTDSIVKMSWKKEDHLWTADKDGCITKWDIGRVDDIADTKLTMRSNHQLKGFWNSEVNDKDIGMTKIKAGISAKISESKIISMEFPSTHPGSILCLDGTHLSFHDNAKPFKPRNVPELYSCAQFVTPPLPCKPELNHRISSYASKSSIGTFAHTMSGDSFNIFDRYSYSNQSAGIPITPNSQVSFPRNSCESFAIAQKDRIEINGTNGRNNR